MGLNKWTPTDKERFFQYLAENYSVPESLDKLYGENPNLHKYDRTYIYRYLSGEEGKSGKERALEALREEAKEQSYAHRGSRVHALVELAERLLRRLREFTPAQVGSRDFVLVSNEFRSTLKDVKAEVEILGIGDSNALDIFSSFVAMLDKNKDSKGKEVLPEFVLKSLGDSPEPN